jgi:hypothetical protein
MRAGIGVGGVGRRDRKLPVGREHEEYQGEHAERRELDALLLVSELVGVDLVRPALGEVVIGRHGGAEPDQLPRSRGDGREQRDDPSPWVAVEGGGMSGGPRACSSWRV